MSLAIMLESLSSVLKILLKIGDEEAALEQIVSALTHLGRAGLLEAGDLALLKRSILYVRGLSP